jgi:hypothetical protein
MQKNSNALHQMLVVTYLDQADSFSQNAIVVSRTFTTLQLHNAMYNLRVDQLIYW